MEHRNAQREPDAHEEVLDIERQYHRHGPADRVDEPGEDPVRVEERDGREGEGEAAHAEGRRGVPVDEANEHGGEDQGRPDAAPGYEGDADGIPAGSGRGEIVDSEAGHHCGVFFWRRRRRSLVVGHDDMSWVRDDTSAEEGNVEARVNNLPKKVQNVGDGERFIFPPSLKETKSDTSKMMCLSFVPNKFWAREALRDSSVSGPWPFFSCLMSHRGSQTKRV